MAGSEVGCADLVVGCTVPLKAHYLKRVQERFPEVRLEVFPDIREAEAVFGRAEVWVTYGMDLTEECVARMPALRWVQVFAAGVDRMPLQELARRGVVVTNARGIHGSQMAEHALGAMIMHSRRFLAFAGRQAERVWDRGIRVDELEGKVLGVLGTGAVGRALAVRARAMGMEVWGYNRSGRAAEGFGRIFSDRRGLEELLAGADYVAVVVPYTPETRGLLGESELRRMKPTAFLVHLARGGVVDERALVRALREGWIAGAAVDVFEEEPLPPDHPFWGMDNCFVTPHVSGMSPKYSERAMEIFLHNLEVYRSGRGEWLNVVDLEKGY